MDSVDKKEMAMKEWERYVSNSETDGESMRKKAEDIARKKANAAKSGCESEYERGYREGYDDGLWEGEKKGFDIGYVTGRDQGYRIGFDAGYEKGKEECNGKGSRNILILLLIGVGLILSVLMAPKTVESISREVNVDKLLEAHADTKSVADALQAYNLVNGEYPLSLKDLEGKYLRSIPKDPSTGLFFEYKPILVNNCPLGYTLTPPDPKKYRCVLYVIPDGESYSTVILSGFDEEAKKRYHTDALTELEKMMRLSKQICFYHHEKKDFPVDISSFRWLNFSKEEIEEIAIDNLGKEAFILRVRNPQKFGCVELKLITSGNEHKVVWE